MLEDSKQDTTKASVAATKIQANFRGYRVRKQLNELKKDMLSRSSGAANREHERHREQGSVEKEEESSSTLKEQNTTRRESLEEKSAIKIQARVRGFLVRKRQQTVRLAATKIQAGYRGFKIRKLLKQSEQ